MKIMSKNSKFPAHLALACAAILWGIMSPMGKTALASGIPPFALASFRMIGGAVCFWVLSLFLPKEKITAKDAILFLPAALMGVVLNQGSFIIGLSYTSPVNASIITTTTPIFTMLLAAVFLKEPITWLKVLGVAMGAGGAIILITDGVSFGGNSSIKGDLLCLSAQVLFSLYLSIFKGLVQRYKVVTVMKWMFLYAMIVSVPVAYKDIVSVDYASLPLPVVLEVLYVVICGTFLAYLLMIYGQQRLRPTLVSMYNYVQPIVATVLSVIMGIGAFGWVKGAAVALVFSGVYVVTRSRSRVEK